MPIVQGHGGLKTFDLEHDSNILATNGTTYNSSYKENIELIIILNIISSQTELDKVSNIKSRRTKMFAVIGKKVIHLNNSNLRADFSAGFA